MPTAMPTEDPCFHAVPEKGELLRERASPPHGAPMNWENCWYLIQMFLSLHASVGLRVGSQVVTKMHFDRSL
jgi:hypothetical protein